MKLVRQMARHKEKAAAMRAAPGVWIEVSTYGSSYGARATGGRIERAVNEARWYTPAGAYETKTEMAEFGTRLFARFKGEEDDRQGESDRR